MSKIRVNTVVNRTNSDKVIFPFGIGVTNGIVVSGVVTATSFVGSGVSLTGVSGEMQFQHPSGEIALTGITTIRIGTGMTITQPGAGIASIRPTGNLESLRVTGIATFGTTGITTVSNTGQIRSQAVGTLIRQSVLNNSDLTTQLALDYPGSLARSIEDGQLYSATTLGVWQQIAKANHSGIITASGGFVAAGSSVGFTGPLNSTGVSTAAFLQATTINVSAAATVGTSLTVTQDLRVGRHVLVSGVTTVTDITANNITANNITVNGGITGKINSSGVSTITQLVASTVNASGIITASTFSGPLSGSVNGNVNGEINSTGISTLGRISVTSINQANGGISTIPQLKGSTISITGVATASSFVGDVTGTATGLSGTPNITVGFVTSKTILPELHNTFDLGSSGVRWANIYSADMHFSNEGSSNSVDGTWGDWTLQEGENDIFMLNNRTGKKYKINLTEV
jgi:hypothetical protein